MNVFISSVVRNFEHYRAAAKKAVSLLGHTPVMCEDFGARPYSSEVACMTEVDQADVVVLILGADFGFKTNTGESVTQQEFHRAKAANKPILAFLEEIPVEDDQKRFHWEVSDYVDGLFRSTFTGDRDLSDKIIQGLSQLAASRSAISEQEFVQHLQNRSNSRNWNSRPREDRLELVFLPQPTLSGTLRSMHTQHDEFFLKLSQAGLVSIKGGYKSFNEGDITGLDAEEASWRHHDNGMSWLSIPLAAPGKGGEYFASYYISPSRLKRFAEEAFSLISRGKGGWFQLGIYGISHQVYAEPPSTPASSMSMPHRIEKNIEERKLLIPASQGVFNQWLEDALFRIGRKLS